MLLTLFMVKWLLLKSYLIRFLPHLILLTPFSSFSWTSFGLVCCFSSQSIFQIWVFQGFCLGSLLYLLSLASPPPSLASAPTRDASVSHTYSFQLLSSLLNLCSYMHLPSEIAPEVSQMLHTQPVENRSPGIPWYTCFSSWQPSRLFRVRLLELKSGPAPHTSLPLPLSRGSLLNITVDSVRQHVILSRLSYFNSQVIAADSRAGLSELGSPPCHLLVLTLGKLFNFTGSLLHCL